MKIRLLLSPIPALLLAFSLPSCSGDHSSPDPSGTKAAGSAGKSMVRVQVAAFQEITPKLDSFGSISFVTKTDITPPVEGTIESLDVKEGQRVVSGQRLARIENLQLKIRETQAATAIESAGAALTLARAEYREGLLQTDARLISIEKLIETIAQKKRELDQTEKELKNKERLFEVGGVSEEQLTTVRLSVQAAQTDYLNSLKELEIQRIGFRDEDILYQGYPVPSDDDTRRRIVREINNLTLKAEINVARSQLSAAESEKKSVDLLVSELVVRSPADGVVGSIYMEEGERLTAGTKLFTLFDDEKVYALFPVREKDLLNLREGHRVTVTVPALEETAVKGTIDLISPTVDPQSGNVIIKAVIDNGDGRLKPGMFCRVTVLYGDPYQAIILPVTALLRREEKHAEIYTVTDSRVFRKSVVTGEEKDGSIEITEGLKEGELIVDSPSPILQEGESVEIIH